MLGAARASLVAQKEYVTTPEAHGWSDQNTVTQNTAAMMSAVAAASDHAGASHHGYGVVELTPDQTYPMITTNGGNRDPNGCIHLKDHPNVWIRTSGQPTTSGRATLLFSAENDDGTDPNYWARSLIACTAPTTNIKITHLMCDGNRLNLNIENMDYNAGGDNGNIHCLSIHGGRNVTIQHVESRNAMIDGLVIERYVGGDSTRPAGILVEDCDFHTNRRQALSIVTCGDGDGGPDQLVFRRCRFRDTGDIWEGTPFASALVQRGQKPGQGVDIEPLASADNCYGIAFYACEVTGNGPASRDFDTILTSRQALVRAFGADIGSYLNLGAVVRWLKIHGCTFSGNNTFNGEDVGFVLRQGGPTTTLLDEVSILRNTVEKNIHFEGFPTSPREATVENCVISDNTVETIEFTPTFAATGNSISGAGNVKQSGAPSTLATNGVEAITLTY
jgi:hypothetical protein